MQYDVVLSNPPFGNGREAAFLHSLIESLDEGGRAAVVVPDGLLYRARDRLTRERLLFNCTLERIVQLPRGSFSGVSVNSCIIFFKKGGISDRIAYVTLRDVTGSLPTARLPETAAAVETVVSAQSQEAPTILIEVSSLDKNLDLRPRWRDVVDADGNSGPFRATDESDMLKMLGALSAPTRGNRPHRAAAAGQASVEVVQVGAILAKVSRRVGLEKEVAYRQVTVGRGGTGARARGTRRGREIRSGGQHVLAENDLIISRIDAQHGAVAIVPSHLQGAVASADFWTFEATTHPPELVLMALCSPAGLRLMTWASWGTSGRQRLDLSRFMEAQIYMPVVKKDPVVAGRLLRATRRVSRSAEGLVAILEGILRPENVNQPPIPGL